MDRSKEYVLMCEKAAKILKLEKISYREASSENPEMTYGGKYIFNKGYNPNTKEHEIVHLLRQDELQEMVFTQITGTYNLVLTKVLSFSDHWKDHGFPIWATSLEKLWLAYVMVVLYVKAWNGSEWVEEG